MQDFDYDVLVVGSGFGGSVSALRLAEKGYRVAVLESGKRWHKDDFPDTNWKVWKWLWAPALKLHGIMRMSFFRHITILSGSGVGGGSLVYANTLLVPPREVFDHPDWGQGPDFYVTMMPYYDKARHMLGVTRTPKSFPADDLLRAYGDAIGRSEHFSHTDVGVYFGTPDVTVPDPFFGGEGPDRTGCNFCGGCMTGCQYGAKNTLDRNYLYLAEKKGARVYPETRVHKIQPIDPEGSGEKGWRVETRNSTSWFGFPRRILHAKYVVLSAGVLGTLPILMKAQDEGLPLSPALGDVVRTNSEAVLGATAAQGKGGYSAGVAIGSSLYVTEETHIEAVRYQKGSNAISLLTTLLTDGGDGLPRFVRYLGNVLRHPVQFLRSVVQRDWADHSVILLVMQTLDNAIKMRRKRFLGIGPRRLVPVAEKGDIPTYIQEGNDAARWFANEMDGLALSSIPEVLMDAPTTAHILGGARLGANPETSVIDTGNKVHNLQNLYVIDGSMIPVNLGVNPSLTITALAEYAMDRFPAADSEAD